MTAFPLPTNASHSFIEDGLIEIFGVDVIPDCSGNEGHLPLLTLVKEKLKRQWGGEEIGGLYIRSGRAAFDYWLRQHAAELGWKENSFRLLPAPARIGQALTDFLRWMEGDLSIKQQVSETAGDWQISVIGLNNSDIVLECNFFAGLIQELCSWAGGGKFYRVSELHCQSEEFADCVFVVDKHPAD